MEAQNLLWLIPALPFAGAALNGILGPKAPRWSTNAVALGAPLASLLVAVICLFDFFAQAAPRPAIEQIVYAWTTGPLSIDVAFLLDQLSAVMLFVVTFVGFLIHLYSAGYMAHEEGYQRYFVYLNLFMGSMLLLVLGNNFLVMFMGWEGVGLCSYLLIGYYYQETTPPAAGKKAFIVNRIGDFGFLAGILAIFDRFGTLEFREVFARITADGGAASGTYALGLTFASFVALCLFIGAMGKSAQIPLYVWLPDAMAGPTPVSALIHAATMVTAGVYMVARANVIYQLAPDISLFVAVIGALTAIFAATIGLAQNDIKKVLAYSTVSQLGYMFLAAGVGAYSMAIFHLGTHAFFKALLFLGSGSVIHAMSGEQDMRQMGGLRKHLPITFWTFFVGWLAIAGVPGLAGFFSKDAILAATFSANKVLWVIGLITAGITAFYMSRLVYLTFFGKFRGSHEQEHHLHESPWTMTVPLVILAVGSVVAGWIGLPPVLAEVNQFDHFLAPVIQPLDAGEHGAHHLSHTTEWILIAASVGVALAGIFLARRLYKDRGLAAEQAFSERAPGVQRLLEGKYFVDELYDRFIVRPTAWLAKMCFKVVDSLVIEGSIGVGTFLTELTGDLARFSTTGNVRNYALYFFLGVVALFWWMIL
ncbi:MAG TPA: NADH-quinone oxidoreductase subunit L [Thermoanaerobaculia bacterium]|nr:NADH-quinone oxidoreductase subunit L [Thermoanaerobaculia bacterium]